MRLKITKSKNSESLYIIKSFRTRSGKNTSKIVEKLGTLEEVRLLAGDQDPYEWARARAKVLTEQENEENRNITVQLSPTKRVPLNDINLFNAGYLYPQKIYHELELDSLMHQISKNSRITYNLNEVLLMLINSRIIYPGSKKSSFETSKHFLETGTFDIQHVYRSLDVLAENSELIQSHIYKKSLNVVKRNSQILYYDCTNYYFEIEEASGYRQYGKSKENRPNPIVQMGLFIDGNGIPLAFNITPGNTNEQTTLKPHEKQIIKDFELSKLVVVTDAGLSSKNNRVFNSFANRAYITVQSLKKIKSHLREWALDSKGWHIPGEQKEIDLSQIELQGNTAIYYKERWINENGIEERFIVSFSPKHALYQKSIRDNQVDRCIKKIDDGTLKRRSRNPNDSTRFAKAHHMTAFGEAADTTVFTIDQEAIQKESQYDGFYAVVTNLEDSIDTILKVNHQRWEIEETFRIMKSEFKSRPVYVQKDNRIEAHFLTCFIAMTIFRILEKRLEEKYTANEIISTLKNMMLKKVYGEGYSCAFERTALTDRLQEIFDYQLDTELVPTDRIKKIKRNSKNKKSTQERT